MNQFFRSFFVAWLCFAAFSDLAQGEVWQNYFQLSDNPRFQKYYRGSSDGKMYYYDATGFRTATWDEASDFYSFLAFSKNKAHRDSWQKLLAQNPNMMSRVKLVPPLTESPATDSRDSYSRQERGSIVHDGGRNNRAEGQGAGREYAPAARSLHHILAGALSKTLVYPRPAEIPGSEVVGLQFVVGGHRVDFFIESLTRPFNTERAADGTVVQFFSGHHFSAPRARGRRDGDVIAKVGDQFYLFNIVP